jgi:ABC-2 type transport system permease protein
MKNIITTNNSIIGEVISSLWVEFQKVRYSKLSWLTIAVVSLFALVAGLFMYILKDPERARTLGLVGAKAQIFGGTANWPSFINLNLIMLSVGGLIIFGFIFVWIFGREFNERTVYDLLSLPTSRLTIVGAKIITATYWSMLLVVLIFILMLGIGTILQLPGLSTTTILNGLGLLLVTGFLISITCIFFAFLASITRGYLAAVGGIFVALILGQIVSQLGYGEYFPWTVPLLYSGAAEALTGKSHAPLGFISYSLVSITGVLSILLTCLWWRYSDQT